MKTRQLVSLVVALHHVTGTCSFERNSNRKFPFVHGSKRSFGMAKVDFTGNEHDLTEPNDENRRNLLVGSAAALGSAIWRMATEPANAATGILEESESRRIDIFERIAPSVVFIDTFTEKQDVFSPNVMEVPLGSGSGFVWDKDGHIGR